MSEKRQEMNAENLEQVNGGFMGTMQWRPGQNASPMTAEQRFDSLARLMQLDLKHIPEDSPFRANIQRYLDWINENVKNYDDPVEL